MIYKKYLMPDSLWDILKLIIPNKKNKFGRPPLSKRKVADGIFYVIFTGIPWKSAPHFFGSPSSLHRYFQKWINEGVFSTLWIKALIEYDEEKGIFWKWRSIDAANIKAPLGGDKTGPNPTDRGKKGTKRSIIVDGNGIPISIEVEGANRHDSKLLPRNLNSIVIENNNNPIYQDYLCGDKAYDSDELRKLIRDYGLKQKITKRGLDQEYQTKKSFKKARRWVVERTFSWINKFGKARVRTDKKAQNYIGILHFVAAYICFRASGLFT